MVFGAYMVSIFTGLIFIVMVTHSLTTPQFGLWEVITDVVAFSAYPVGVVNFWAARDTGRAKRVGKTAVVANLVLSAAGGVIFTMLAFVGKSAITTSFYLFGSALVLVPISYWYRTTNAILSVHRPQASANTLMASEASKLASGYFLIYVFRLGLPGVLLALAASSIVQGGLGTYYVRETLEGGFSLGQWRRWFTNAWVPILNSVPVVIGIADTYVAFLVSGGYTLTGYYQAAFSVANLVGYSGYLSYALYPLLLRGAAERMIGVLFDFSMMFGIPMAAGAAALSPQLLYLLSPRYTAMSEPLVILAFSALAIAVSLLLDNALMGKDTSDLAAEDKVRTLLRGNLVFVPAVNLAYYVVYIASVGLIVYWGDATGLSYAGTVTLWAIAQGALGAAVVGVKIRRLGLAALSGVGPSLAKYAFSAAVMAAAVVAAAHLLLPGGLTTVVFGLRLCAIVVAGGAVYFGLLAAIDKPSRDRVKRMAGILLP